MRNSEIIQFTFSESEKLKTYDLLNEITINPYQNYDAFMMAVADIVRNGEVPERFLVHVKKREKKTNMNHLTLFSITARLMRNYRG